jgi:glycogen debranching enzyme
MHLKSTLWLLGASTIFALVVPLAGPQQTPTEPLALNTEAVAPLRFIAAHGRRALISGYASEGLEIWAYPFQILDNYRISFRPQGTTTSLDAANLLRRVTYTPNTITRIYLGPDFSVRETLFVPLDEPAAIVTFAVQSDHPVDIEVHAIPILNLMWPAGIGGQSSSWNPDLSAFVLSEPASNFGAVIGSPDIIAHDDVTNRTYRGPNANNLSFTIHPSPDGVANVYVALNRPNEPAPALLFHNLVRDRKLLQTAYESHIADLAHTNLAITTPDPQVNQAIAWSEIALDQAWVCNPDLGCGYVAGYGPSRNARRPQYDWFFAGDGLIAADAAVSSGNAPQARKELEFILHYQDKKTGMIWHELSQSAAFLDWVGKYPYMYVHVDITFQFLAMLSRYITSTGDLAFARDNWSAIAAAYQYCNSLIDPITGLPVIPSDKEGGDEQDREVDDFGLSLSWVEASSSFQKIASLTGHATEAAQAATASERARASIPSRYWDQQQSFWINGFSQSHHPLPEQRSSPSEAISLHPFTAAQEIQVLDKLASASFQTDWGSRGVSATSPGFDPTSYAKGSVSALGTAELATTFWTAHRPVSAFNIWSTLLPLTTLDSLGHIHEVLAGNAYRAQDESVPEQTWSSAGFLSSTIHGLFGLTIDALNNSITFAPHLPPTWHDVSIANIPAPNARLSLALHHAPTELTLNINNPGDPIQINFAPSLPLGAAITSADLNHHRIIATVDQHPQDATANIHLTAPHGTSELHLSLHGGISAFTNNTAPLIGDTSHNIRIIDLHLAGNILSLVADIPTDHISTLDLETEWPLIKATGAQFTTPSHNLNRITIDPPHLANTLDSYQHVELTFQFQR